ncbi:polynucleotide kinase-phosphatase [Desertivirga xinjiangensis]|uniref:polynucleotide kinase-phosphatase n=1 Tax=Desertivirga xinjiangensis TaxID=539206 RepID=UPI00210DC2E4|nr:polynucleotide kinase-phosphatase [Pedobacter xinjiangensis]
MRDNKVIKVPELSLIVLIGASGSGKSTFARQHFKETEIVSSDKCRGMVSDDENNQVVSSDAFALARYITSLRLKNSLLTVIDATNVQDDARKDWIKLAREYHVLPVALVLNLPEKVCTERNALRSDRDFGKHVIPQHISQLKRSLKKLKLEGFRHVIELKSLEEVNAVTAIARDPLYNNKKNEKGPFDIIGDVHGCYDELVELLHNLAYVHNGNFYAHPEGRRAVFLGDLVDRGPKTPAVLKLVMEMVEAGTALCVPGNHDIKLVRWLNGKNVQVKHGLAESIGQLSAETQEFRDKAKVFLDGLVSHYVLDEGKLVVAHAGLKENMQGRGSGAVREFCYYGETTGEIDEFGLPVRYNWAAEYAGKAMVVYGHTPVPLPQWLNRTIDIDTGCVFGGALTALRYPEKELVSVKAAKVYCEPVRPLLPEKQSNLSLQQENDDVLDIAELIGKQIIETKYAHNVTIREENAIAALEVMSRFAVNPKWLIYLPPTMSPCKTSEEGDYLEYPSEGFEYYKNAGVKRVVCEEKHMGSRAVLIVGKDEGVIERVFGIRDEGIGTVYTRTGRAFFNEKETEQALLNRMNDALVASGFYEKFETDWVCLDTELMPWSAKAQALLETQYASVGAAATHALTETLAILNAALERNPLLAELSERYSNKLDQVSNYKSAYGNYCWNVNKLEDYKIAPFHILATEGKVWTEQNHEWHMETIKSFCLKDPAILLATPYRIVDLEDADSVNKATEWWLSLTGKGGEGMVIKPYDFVERDKKGLVQPAVKVRGREYLRIIYGPEYTSEENLTRLRSRSLNAKRSLAMREFALGVEGLERFIHKEPLRKVHQCTFGVLALESEPVDPRL